MHFLSKPIPGKIAVQGPNGRWFITMNNPGFNSPANNRDGYISEDAAVSASKRYGSR